MVVMIENLYQCLYDVVGYLQEFQDFCQAFYYLVHGAILSGNFA